MMFKVCILTAGVGKRMGALTKNLNKALLPLNGKAIISHIIEKFPKNIEFVIGLGHLGNQVRDYLDLAHPEIKKTFIQVDNYIGVNSGPGNSLISCRNTIGDSPFFFVPCDTLWESEIDFNNLNENWVAVSKIQPELSVNFCNFLIVENKVVAIENKKHTESKNSLAFTGLAFILNTEIFWNSLIKEKKLVDNEKQMTDGFVELIRQSYLNAKLIKWIDIGSAEKYEEIAQKQSEYNFSKPEEAIYFVNNKVIKFFVNEKITNSRVERAKINNGVFPKSILKHGNFYSYDFQNGYTLYRFCDSRIFQKFLVWTKNEVWKKQQIDNTTMHNACLNFYKNKTLERIDLYKEKYSTEIIYLDGEKIPTIEELVNNINWQKLYEGEARFIHGDLQPDNIIYDKESDKFILLDWRQDFSGHLIFGDIYYDLSKLMGGLILNYDRIKKMEFSYSEKENSCIIKFPSHDNFKDLITIYNQFLKENQFSIDKINLLVGLIYINMAPLHHYPFDKLLQIFGRKIIFDSLDKFNQASQHV